MKRNLDILHSFFLCVCVCWGGGEERDVFNLGQPDCQHAVIDKFLCMVARCALGTDVYITGCLNKFNMVQGQQDSPLRVIDYTPESRYNFKPTTYG